GFSRDWSSDVCSSDLAGVDQKDQLEYEIAGRDSFKVVNVQVPDGDNSTLLINFSDPVATMQDFDGLVAVESATATSFSTEGNILKAYFDEPLKGSLLVEVFEGIASEDGYKLKETYAEKVAF